MQRVGQFDGGGWRRAVGWSAIALSGTGVLLFIALCLAGKVPSPKEWRIWGMVLFGLAGWGWLAKECRSSPGPRATIAIAVALGVAFCLGLLIGVRPSRNVTLFVISSSGLGVFTWLVPAAIFRTLARVRKIANSDDD